MEGDVKCRPYRSGRRREQAEETRVRVLDAAGALFEERGYEGASIAAIAAAAGVSQETHDARFGTKRALLGGFVARAVRGADPRPVPEQEWTATLAAVSDQREQLRLFAADIAERLERAAPLVTLIGAARAEPELRGAARAPPRRAAHKPTRVAGRLAPTQWPAPPPGEGGARDGMGAHEPGAHQLLVRVRGWSRSRYRAWLVDSLAALLTASPARFAVGSTSRSSCARGRAVAGKAPPEALAVET